MAGIVVTLALLVAGCGGSAGEGLDTEDEASATDAKAMMDAAMGGTPAVQDFLLYLDMSVQTDDGPVSYYDEVLERATQGAAEPVELAGGFTLTAVDSLEGDVGDSSGEAIPSLSLDFGVLTAGPEARSAGAEALAAVLAASNPDAEPFRFDESESDGRGLLVEIFTADFAESRTHVGPGDVGAVDLTFVSKIAPGDDLTSAYVLGQTFPGDPAEEAGLSPHELFAYRWNRGLIGALGDNGDVGLSVDGTVIAIEGSTMVLTRPKQAAVFEATLQGDVEGARILEAVRANDFVGPYEIFDLRSQSEGYSWRVLRQPDGNYTVVLGDENRVDPDVDRFGTVAGLKDVTPEGLIELLGTVPRFTACVVEATRLLKNNEAAFGPLDTDAIDTSELEDDATPSPAESANEYCEDPPGIFDLLVAGTYGDVHMTTFDGSSYDNQAAGEFLVFDNDTATVQARLAPWPGSDAVSIVTAVAVGVGDHEISMHQGSRLWVDGEERELQRGETVAVGDAALLWTGTGWVIVWPDGTEVRVTGGLPRVSAEGASTSSSPLMMLIVSPEGNAEGMFGSPDGDWTNDWVTRSGELLDPEIRFDFENFYPTYVDTWRITEDESLFRYDSGESTATFTIEGFPRVKYDLDDLDPDARADAEAACAAGGIERPEMLEGCTLDVALTGDYGFVYDTYVVQSHTPAAPADVEVDEPPPPADGQNALSIGPLTIGFGAEPPSVVPNSAVQWQCQAADGSLFATSRFQETEDRQYEITIEYLDAETSRDGAPSFRLIVRRNGDPTTWMQTADASGTLDSIELDGSTLTASGTAFLNDPFNPAFFPGGGNLDSSGFEAFALQVNCDR